MVTKEAESDQQTQANPPQTPPQRLHISGTQVAASALAAVTATVAGSYLGVSGTVIGAALASVLTVLGNAVYGHSLRRTGHRVRQVVPLPARGDENAPARANRLDISWIRWRPVTIASVALFAAILISVTGFEMFAGKPLSAAIQGHTANGTSLLGGASKNTAKKTPITPAKNVAVIPTRTATVMVTPTVTKTASTKTVTQTPTTKNTSSAKTSAKSSGSAEPTKKSTPPPTPAPTTPDSSATPSTTAATGAATETAPAAP